MCPAGPASSPFPLSGRRPRSQPDTPGARRGSSIVAVMRLESATEGFDTSTSTGRFARGNESRHQQAVQHRSFTALWAAKTLCTSAAPVASA
jgi:hypothetical protein